MTICTFQAHTLIVSIVLQVTVDALAGRVTTFFTGYVAIGAQSVRVVAEQFEIRKGVIELGFVKSQNVSVSALMIGMAGRTFVNCGLLGQAVKSDFVGNVTGDIFVTVKTKVSLL